TCTPRKSISPCPRCSTPWAIAAASSRTSPPTARRSKTSSSRSPEGICAMHDQRTSSSDTRYYPVVELTLSRMREFLREPEAVFWVFAFPVLMALALGVAFRSQKPQEVVAGVVQGEGSTPLTQALAAAGGIRVRSIAPNDVEISLRNGYVSVVIFPGTPPTSRYAPTRPESHVARLVVDSALQRAAGRRDACTARD